MLGIGLRNYRKVTLCMNATRCANAIKPVQTEYCRMDYGLNWKSLKQKRRCYFSFDKFQITFEAYYIDFYFFIHRDGH